MTLSNTGPSRARHAGGHHRARGFTLLELLTATALLAILAAIAIPAYQSHLQTAKVAAATADTVLDPWGQPYVYLDFTGLKGKGQMRKDKNLVPINTQYDLYSVGADGQSKPPLTTPVSKDDVILANDGNYIGLASNY